MATGAPLQLNSFVHWIRETDAHAAHHVSLLERAEHALDQPSDVDPPTRRVLAGKIERWRYQHLKERAGQLTAQDESFAVALDLAAKQLAVRGIERPRLTRRAVGDAALDNPAWEEALAAIEPDYPLDRLTQRAANLTCEHFSSGDTERGSGRRRMLLYAPLYVSSECINYCAYCGFRYPLDIARKHLSLAEATEQVRLLKRRGLQNLLVVGGDFPSRTTTDYYTDLIKLLTREGMDSAIEIAPQSTESYAQLVEAGVRGLTLYQETYDETLYARYHARGPKSSYDWRLEAHDRAAEAGMDRLGLGVLLGLAKPRNDLRALMRHAAYLADRFPDRTLAFSLPRIHQAPEGFRIPYRISDEQLVQFYAALRIAFPAAELVLSTREPLALRNRLANVCITQMSAGSSTAPGGYQPSERPVGQQFPVADHRSPAEVADWLEQRGFQICWTWR